MSSPPPKTDYDLAELMRERFGDEYDGDTELAELLAERVRPLPAKSRSPKIPGNKVYVINLDEVARRLAQRKLQRKSWPSEQRARQQERRAEYLRGKDAKPDA